MFPQTFPGMFLQMRLEGSPAQLQLILIMMEALCRTCGNTKVNTEIRCLVLLILVLGTHVGKLYSASTLLLSLSASCSWDGGSRASAQLKLNVP
jgi:hypothetical protein